MSRLYRPGDTYTKSFTVSSATGAAANADSAPTVNLVQNGTLDGAVTVTTTNPETGRYKSTCTIPSGYAAGDTVELEVAATIGGVATKAVVDTVRLVAWPVNALPNAAAGAAGGVPLGDASGNVTVGSLTTAALALIWTVLTSTLTTAGSIGKRIADNLDATVSSRNSGNVTLAAGQTVQAVTNPVTVTGSVQVGSYASGQDPVTLFGNAISLSAIPTKGSPMEGIVFARALAAGQRQVSSDGRGVSFLMPDGATVAFTLTFPSSILVTPSLPETVTTSR